MGTDEERGKPRPCKLLGCLSCKRGAAWKTQCEAGCCCPSSALVIPTPPAPRAEPASPLHSHSPTHTPSPLRSYQNQGWKRGHGHSLWLSREIKVSRDKCQEEKRPIQAKDNAGKNKHGYKLAKKQFRLDIRIRLKESHDDLWQPSRRSREDNRIKWILRQGPRGTWKDSILPPLLRFMTMTHYHSAFHSNFTCPLTLPRQKYACQRITCWNTKVCNLFP